MPKIKQWNGTSWVTFDAGNADVVPWSGVTGKPTTVTGYGITDAFSTGNTTFTGTLTLSADPTTSLQAATKQYVDSKSSGGSSVTTVYDDDLIKIFYNLKSNAIRNKRVSVPVLVGDTAYFFGGSYSTVDSFNFTTRTWNYQLTNSPFLIGASYYTYGAVHLNGLIYIVDSTSNPNMYIYSIDTDSWIIKNYVPYPTTLQSNPVFVNVSGVFYLLGSGYAMAYDPVTDTWTSKANMTSVKHGMASVLYNGLIYLIGGQTSSVGLSAIETYDPSSNTYSTKTATGFTGRANCTALEYNGDIFVFGGYTTTSTTYTNSVQSYNVAGDSWTTKSATFAPGSLYFPSMVKYNNLFYFFSGAFGSSSPTGSNVITSQNCYNPSSDTYSNDFMVDNTFSRACPSSNVRSTACAIGDNIYLIGGDNASSVPVAINYLFNTKTGTWTSKSTTGFTARFSLASAAIGTTIYAIGGRTSSTVFSNAVEAYDTTSDTWSTKSSTGFTARSGLYAIASGTIIYAIGGQTGTTTYTGVVEAYDTVGNTWSSKTSMTTARRDFFAGLVNGVIYCIGGYNGNPLSTNEAYNISGNSWTTKTSMKIQRYALSGGVSGSTIYCLMGADANTYSSSYNEAYDTTSDTWSFKQHGGGSNYASYSAHATVSNRIYCFNGSTNSTTLSAFTYPLGYDISIDRWEISNTMHNTSGMYPRSHPGSVILGNEIFMIGGFGGSTTTSALNSPLSTNQSFNPLTGLWTNWADMPTARARLTCSAVNGIIYCIGGSTTNSSASVAVNEAFNPTTNTWSTKSTTGFTARWGLGSAVINGVIYCIGGSTGAAGSTSSALNEAYDPSSNTWTTKANMTTARFHLSIVPYGGIIYCIGGGTTSATATTGVNEAYDPSNNTWTSKASLAFSLKSMNSGIMYDPSNIVKTYIACTGGIDNSSANNVSVYAYTIATNAWSTRASAGALSNGAFGVICNILYSISGSNNASGYSFNTEINGYIETASFVLTESATSDGDIYTVKQTWGGDRNERGTVNFYNTTKSYAYNSGGDSAIVSAGDKLVYVMGDTVNLRKFEFSRYSSDFYVPKIKILKY